MTNTAAPKQRNWSDLRPRIISAVVLASVCFSLVYSGVYGTALLTFVGTCAMIWEWSRIATRSGVRAGLVEQIVGYALVVAAPLGFLWLRADADFGLLTAIWLTLVVIAADVGANFAGRIFGGPKLAPKISPNKTISGALGGLGLALITGVAVSMISGTGTIWVVAVMSLLLALFSQVGDLVESAAKRRHGVKDSSNLIPGHGGVLDRFDGFIGACLFLAAVTAIAGATVFAW